MAQSKRCQKPFPLHRAQDTSKVMDGGIGEARDVFNHDDGAHSQTIGGCFIEEGETIVRRVLFPIVKIDLSPEHIVGHSIGRSEFKIVFIWQESEGWIKVEWDLSVWLE